MAESPFWLSDDQTAPDAPLLEKLNDTADLKVVLTPDVSRAVLNAAKSKGAAWLYTFLYNKMRSELGLMDCFDDLLKDDMAALANLSLKSAGGDSDRFTRGVAADKVAWLHSALIGHLSERFSEQDVTQFVESLIGQNGCSKLGQVEAITNLLKSTSHRALVWKHPKVQDVIFEGLIQEDKFLSARDDEPDQANRMYKVMFAFWMLTYDAECMNTLAGKAAPLIKKFLTSEKRVEKVVRLSLVVLQAFLKSKTLTEDLASNGLLEVVQSLGYEKWRDNDLYEQIRALGQSIQSAVSEVSNYERYIQELNGGIFTKGYLHSSKFWAENFSKFTEKDVKDIAALLKAGAEDTKAIACFDLGELAVLHRHGKKWIAGAGAKDQVMQLMTGSDRETRREALLCCQKIMLKWQEVPLK